MDTQNKEFNTENAKSFYQELVKRGAAKESGMAGILDKLQDPNNGKLYYQELVKRGAAKQEGLDGFMKALYGSAPNGIPYADAPGRSSMVDQFNVFDKAAEANERERQKAAAHIETLKRKPRIMTPEEVSAMAAQPLLPDKGIDLFGQKQKEARRAEEMFNKRENDAQTIQSNMEQIDVLKKRLDEVNKDLNGENNAGTQYNEDMKRILSENIKRLTEDTRKQQTAYFDKKISELNDLRGASYLKRGYNIINPTEERLKHLQAIAETLDDDVAKDIVRNQSLIMDAMRNMQRAKRKASLDNDASGWSKFWSGLVTGFDGGAVLTFGIADISEALHAKSALRRMQDGTGTTADRILINTLLDRMGAEELYKPGTAGQIGQGVYDSLEFMLDMAITGGIGGAAIKGVKTAGKAIAKTAGKSIAKEATETAAKSATKQFAKQIGKDIAASAVGSVVSPMMYNEVVRRQNENYMFSRDENGEVTVKETANPESLAESFTQALLSNNISRVVERGVGPVLEKGMQALVKPLAKVTPQWLKFGNNFLSNLGRNVKNWMSVQGFVPESAEEFVEEILTRALVSQTARDEELGVSKWEDLFSPEWCKVTLGSVAVIQAAMGLPGFSANTANAAANASRMRKHMNNLPDNIRLDVRRISDMEDDNQRAQALSALLKRSTDLQRVDIMGYMTARAANNLGVSFSRAEAQQQEEENYRQTLLAATMDGQNLYIASDNSGNLFAFKPTDNQDPWSIGFPLEGSVEDGTLKIGKPQQIDVSALDIDSVQEYSMEDLLGALAKRQERQNEDQDTAIEQQEQQAAGPDADAEKVYVAGHEFNYTDPKGNMKTVARGARIVPIETVPSDADPNTAVSVAITKPGSSVASPGVMLLSEFQNMIERGYIAAEEQAEGDTAADVQIDAEGNPVAEEEAVPQENQPDAVTDTETETSNTVAPVVAGDYLMNGGVDSIKSSDYFLKALSGVFRLATNEIERIRIKYAAEIRNQGYDDSVNAFKGSKLWNDIISEIREIIGEKYGNNEDILKDFDQIVSYPSGLPVKLGNEIQSRIDKFEDRQSWENNTQEFDENGRPFVKSKDGTTIFGEIGEDSGLTAAPIRLSVGIDKVDETGSHHGYGLAHIEAGHGEQIRNAGYATIEDFVEEVARNYTDIREGTRIAGTQTYLLEVSDKLNNTLFIQLSKNGEYWNVNSAGIFRKKYSRNKPKVSTVPAVGLGTNADVEGVNHGQSEGATVTSGDSPKTLQDKGTEVSEENQVRLPENPVQTQYEALLAENEGNEAEAVDTANQMVSNKTSELEQARKIQAKGKTVEAIQAAKRAKREKIAALETEVQFWKDVAAFPERKRQAEEAARKMQKRIDAQQRAEQARKNNPLRLRLIDRDKALGEPLSLEEYVLRRIATGATKFLWNSTSQGTGGLKEHGGGKRFMLQFVDNNMGKVPEVVADDMEQDIRENHSELGNVTASEILNVIEDIGVGEQSFSDLMTRAEELHNKPSEDEERYNEEALEAYEEEQRKERAREEAAEEHARQSVESLSDEEYEALRRPQFVGEMFNVDGTHKISDQKKQVQNAPKQPTETERAIARAEAQTEKNPTEGQKAAGNYRMGHVKVNGFDITIENPKGSERSGVDGTGRAWRQTINNTYGYIRGTEGVDGDHIDVFLSDAPESGYVFVVDQVNPKTGAFDEHKVMMGFDSETAAREAYLSNYEDGWQGLGGITRVSHEEFKKWIDASHRKTKPFADYNSVDKKNRMLPHDLRTAYLSGDKAAIVNAENAIREVIRKGAKESPNGTFATYQMSKDATRNKQNDEATIKTQNFIAEECKAAMIDNGYPKEMFYNLRARRDLAATTDRADVLDVMAHDMDWNVKDAVVHNPHTSDETLKYFAESYKNSGTFGWDAEQILAERDAAKNVNKEQELYAGDRFRRERFNNGVMTEEEYLASKGYTFMGYGEPALHKGRQKTERAQDKIIKNYANSAKEYDEKRANLKKEYLEKVERGELRAPTEAEMTIEQANGNPESAATQAARRSADKRGINWRMDDENEQVPFQRVDGSTSPRATEQQAKAISRQLKKLGLKGKVRIVDGVGELVKESRARLQSVFHGSGADFEAFDFSHMGEGEGAQAYGWGGYVTEVKGIGMTYAESTSRNKSLLGLEHDYYSIKDNLEIKQKFLQNNREDLAEARKRLEENERQFEWYKRFAEWLKSKYGENSLQYQDHISNGVYAAGVEIAKNEILRLERAIDSETKEVAELEQVVKDKWEEIQKIIKNQQPKHLYTVEIPDDTGSNYLTTGKTIPKSSRRKIADVVRGISDDELTRKRHGVNWLADGVETLANVIERNQYDAEDIRRRLVDAFGSEKRASEIMSEAGFVGISYPAQYRTGGRSDGARNYVIFKESDMKITDHIRYEQDGNGEIAGATLPNGDVLLNREAMRMDTPFHEFAHKLFTYAKSNKAASSLYDAIRRYAKDAPKSVKDYVSAHYPSLSEDAYLDEVFAWALSQQSESGLEAFLQERGLWENDAARTWYGQVWDAIKSFWAELRPLVSKMMGRDFADLSVFDAYNKISTEETGKALYELMMGGKALPGAVETRSEAGNEDIRFRFIGEKGAGNLDRAEEATTRLDNLAVAREMEEAGKDAKAVKMATGWERGADGKWRYETEDNLDGVEFKTQDELEEEYRVAKKEADKAQRKYSDFYKNPELYSRASKKNSTEENERLRSKRAEAQKYLKELIADYNRLEDIARKLWERANDGIQGVPLPDVIGKNHPLLQAYPEMNEITVDFYPSGRYIGTDGSNGHYNHRIRSMFIRTDGTREKIRSTISHELQHAVQDIEGFAPGGNPVIGGIIAGRIDKLTDVQRKFIDSIRLYNEFKSQGTLRDDYTVSEYVKGLGSDEFGEDFFKDISVMTDEEIQREYERLSEMGKRERMSAMEAYLSLAGEVEARNVQKRLAMTPEERRTSLASETEDVSREDQIFLYKSLGENASFDFIGEMFDADGKPIVPYSEENGNFASKYETKDGKTIRYKSENPWGYGDLFDFDYSEEKGRRSDADLRTGTDGLQREENPGDRLNQRDNRLDSDSGEFSVVERVFTESGSFNFTSGEKIESAADVAFIFSSLEDAAKEHSFVVFVNDGKPTVVELGMGTFSATMVDTPTVSLAYNRIKPDKVYFVHNHPSGELKCSQQDINMLNLIGKISDVPVLGVIINLKTGKYGTFDEDKNSNVGEKRIPKKEYPLTVHTLDKQIFANDYDPSKQPEVHDSKDVAKFLNSQRMGDRAKMSFLILSRGGKIIGNIHTPFTKLTKNADKIARYIAERIVQFGGDSAILYGDFGVEADKRRAYRNLKERIQDVGGHTPLGGPTLLDVVRVEGNNTRSIIEDGILLEPVGEATKNAKRSAVEALSKRLGVPVVIEDKTTPKGRSKRYGAVKGWIVLPNAQNPNGVIHVNVDNHASVADVESTIAHEVVAHFGMRKLMGEKKYNTLLDKVYESMNTAARAYFESYAAKDFVRRDDMTDAAYRAELQRIAADEYIAALAEVGTDPSTWQKVVALIRDAMRALGFNLRLSDADIRALLYESKHNLESAAYAAEREMFRQGNDAARAAAELSNRIEEDERAYARMRRDLSGTEYDKRLGVLSLTPDGATKRQERHNLAIAFGKALLDSSLPVKDLTNYLRYAQGGRVTSTTDLWSLKTTIASKTMHGIDRFNKNTGNPLSNTIRDIYRATREQQNELGIPAKKKNGSYYIGMYLMAKHMPERNAWMLTDRMLEKTMTDIAQRIFNMTGGRGALAEKDLNELRRAVLTKFGTEYNEALSESSIRDITRQLHGLIEKRNKERHEKEIARAEKQGIEAPVNSMQPLTKEDIDKVAEKAYTSLNEKLEKLTDEDKDFSGATAFIERFGMKPEEYVERFEAMMSNNGLEDELAKMWGLINQATNETLRERLESGLLSEEAYNNIMARGWKNYVPLRSWDERNEESAEFFEIEYPERIDNNSTVFTNPTLRAEGRRSLADNPLPYIFRDAETAIRQGEENRFFQAVAKLRDDNANMTYIFGNADFLNGKETAKEKNSHLVPYYNNGVKSNVVFVNPKLAAAVRGDTESAFGKVWRSAALNWIPPVTRFMSAMLTSMNPVFATLNLMRDLGLASISRFVEAPNPIRGTLDAAIFFYEWFRNMPAAIQSSAKPGSIYTSNGRNAQLIRAWKENGGETGWHTLNDLRQTKDKLYKDITKSGIKKSLENVAASIPNAFRFFTEVSENSVRLAAFSDAKRRGLDDQAAAFYSKEVTTNFNRHSNLSSAVNPLFMFFNASTQGINRILQLMKENPGNFGVAAIGMIMAGFVSAITNTAGGGDDDDYLHRSFYIRSNNLVVGKWTIPLAHGFRMFYGLGAAYADYIMGNASEAEMFYNMLGTVGNELLPGFTNITDLASYNPVEDQMNLDLGGYVRNVAPSAILPFFEIYTNRNFMGGTISKETLSKYQPRVARSKKNVNPYLEALNQKWAGLWGFDPELDSEIAWDDQKGRPTRYPALSASDIEHIISQYAGGTGEFVNDIIKVADKIGSGEDFSKADIPVLKKLYRPTDPEHAIMGDYYTIKEYADVLQMKIDESWKQAYEKSLSASGRKKVVNRIRNLSIEQAKSQLKAFETYEEKVVELYRLERQGASEEVLKPKRIWLMKEAANIKEAMLLELEPEQGKRYKNTMDIKHSDLRGWAAFWKTINDTYGDKAANE